MRVLLDHASRLAAVVLDRLACGWRMRVMILSEDQRTVHALEFLLRYQPNGMAVEHADCQSGLLGQIGQMRPHVILVDSDSSPALLTVALDVSRTLPHACQIIVLSNQSALEQKALDMGADAFVTKSEPPDRLIAKLREIQLKSNLGIGTE